MSAVDSARREDAPFVKKYRGFWEAERAAAWLYRELAALSPNAEDARTLELLAKAEDKHAAHWAGLLAKSGVTDLRFDRAPRRERVLAWVARRFGVEKVLPTLIRAEAADAGMYIDVPEAPEWMSNEEVEHGQRLASLGKTQASQISRVESRHRVSRGGALRAATFGVNDGLVSNLSIIMAFAASRADSDPNIVLLAGIGGLLAGAFSMAAGEWVSVRSQTELYEREIAVEAEELRLFPEEEREELELIYRAKGVAPDAAKALAERIMQRKDTALDTLVREELGLDPSELGSPWVAATSSFVAFGIGAAVPMIPWIFLDGSTGIAVSAGLSAAALALVGMAISVLTGKNAWMSAARMVVVGAIASAITFGVGSFFDTPAG